MWYCLSLHGTDWFPIYGIESHNRTIYFYLSDFICFQQQAWMGDHSHFHFSCNDDILSDTAYLSHHLQRMKNVDGATSNGCRLADGRQATLCVPINAKYGYCYIATSSILPDLSYVTMMQLHWIYKYYSRCYKSRWYHDGH